MLEGLSCLVTGASSGIGKATCQVLTKQRAVVIGTGRNREALEELKSQGDILDYFVADLTVDGSCKQVVEKTVQLLKEKNLLLTTLVNAAGVLQGGAVGDMDMANYHTNMKANTQAPLEMMIYAIPHLKEAATALQNTTETTKENKEEEKKEKVTMIGPSIINVSSVNGKQSFPSCAAYCMSKAALDQLTRCASVDLAPFGIRVNSVNPGVITTQIHSRAGMSPEQYQAFLKKSIDTTHPLSKSLGRVGKPEEVGEVIAFLASNKAMFMTGECIAIDGGRQNLGAR